MADAIPAIGYSITANLGGDRQLVFQCFVAEDDDNATVNGKLDRAMDLIDRQKARAELPDLRDELDKHERALAQFEEDKARLDTDHIAAQARRDVEIGALQRQADETAETGRTEHARSGRQLDYKPSGHVKATLDRIKVGIAAVRGEKDKADAERDQALQNLGISVQRFQQEIDRLKGKIADREAKLKDD